MPEAPEQRSPKKDLAEYGIRLLNDAENSTNPELIKLREKYVAKYLDAHLKANTTISSRTAVAVTVPILMFLLAFCVYAAVKLSHSAFISIVAVSMLFALLLVLFMLAISGHLGENVVADAIVKMYNSVAGILKPKTETDE